MTPRQLKRLEDLLRLGLDKSTSWQECDSAIEEALRMVVAARAGVDIDWRAFTAMRYYYDCAICGEAIKPTTRAWKNDDNYRHDKCHREKEDQL